MFPSIAAAQLLDNPRFDHITMKEGLSQMAVYCIHQDRTGFLWFATQDGLNRYDGHTLKIFRNNPSDPNTPSDNFIRKIAEDREGIMWLATFGKGLDRFDPFSGTFEHFIHDPRNSNSLSHNSITALTAARNGIIWVGTYDSGLNSLNPGSRKVKHFQHDPRNAGTLSNNFITDIIEDNAGQIWIATQNGVNRLDPATGQVVRYYATPGRLGGLGDSYVNCLCLDRSGSIWAGGASGGADRYDASTDSFFHYGLPHCEIPQAALHLTRVILQDSRGLFWIGSEGGGLMMLDMVREKIRIIRANPQDPYGLAVDFIYSILEDRSGLIWLGSQGGGVMKYNPKTAHFKVLRSQPQQSGSLSDNMIYCVYAESASTIWIGTRDGLNRYDANTGVVTHYQWNAQNPKSISHNQVHCIAADAGGNLWVGVRKGLDRLDRATGAFEHFPKDPDYASRFSNGTINAILPDKYGDLWLATTNSGLVHFNPRKEKYRRFQHEANNPDSINSNYVFTVLGDPDDGFWIGTSEGVCRFTPSLSKFTRYAHQPDNPDSLSSNKIMALHADADGILWIGTLGGGLNRMDPDNGAIRRYTESDGLTNQTVYGILEDENHFLWLSTNQGIFRLSPWDGAFLHYDESDGLPGNEFNNGSFCKGPDGRLFFGGINGLVMFYSQDLKPNPYIPPVVITEFKKFNRPVSLPKNIFALRDLTLSYKDNVFSFEFASLDYTSPSRNRYAFKMEGFDRDWMYASADKPFATYTNLSPGRYAFRVKASNSSGAWNENGATLNIAIHPPWWNTFPFRIGLISIALIGFILLYRLRMHFVKKQQQKLETIINERTEDIKNKTNELERINNIVKAINSEVDLPDLLAAVLRETFDLKVTPEAAALIHDEDSGLYRAEVQTGHTPGPDEPVEFTPVQFAEKYLNHAISPIPDVFLSKNEHNARLILRIPGKEHPAGYLIFKNLPESTVYDPQRLKLLESLKDHIVSAFMRAKLLLDLRTANQRAEKERRMAEAASRSKSDFLARMSHEIRTPMSSVIGFTDILMDTELSEEQMDYARTINRSGESLLSLINDILDFSRVESGQLALEAIDFDPEAMAFDVCELMRPRIGPKPVEIICRISDRVPSNVKGDPGRYRQVLINLMGNAVKFTDQGEIELSIDVEAENSDAITLHAIVKDTGVGIPKEKQQSIFECFQQADDSTSREYGGSGLGLAICKQISRLMKGDVWVESSAGAGSAFHFTAILEKSGKRPTRPITPESLTGKKVLVVDDNRNNLDILTHLLTSAGMEVVTLTRGSDVLPMLLIGQKTRSPFDLCILDIQMPDISGYEVARRIRSKDSPSPELPLLAFTSSYSVRSRTFRESGFDGFLPKPIQRGKLIEILENLMGVKKARIRPENGQWGVPAGPAANPSDHPLPTPTPEPESPPVPRSVIRILVAEDNPINQKLAKFILTKAGHAVEVVDNGEQAVETFFAKPDQFDLIFMDVQMPKMSGIEASQAIRGKGIHSVPIIAMTAQAMKGDREKCLAAGMNDYISKPIKREVVFDMVRKWTASAPHEIPPAHSTPPEVQT